MEWSTYWVVYSVFGLIEYIGYNFFNTLPFYWLIKCVFLIWLMSQGRNGAFHILYHRCVRLVVLKYRSATSQKSKYGNINLDIRSDLRNNIIHIFFIQ